MIFHTSHTLYTFDPDTGDELEIPFTAHWKLLKQDGYYGAEYELDYCQALNPPIFLTTQHYREMEELAYDDPPDGELYELARDEHYYEQGRDDPHSRFYVGDDE